MEFKISRRPPASEIAVARIWNAVLLSALGDGC
jgi:hypothetical protein